MLLGPLWTDAQRGAALGADQLGLLQELGPGPGGMRDPQGAQRRRVVPDQVGAVDVHWYRVQLPVDGELVEQAAGQDLGPALLGVECGEVGDLARPHVVGQLQPGVPLVGVGRVIGKQAAGQDRLGVGARTAGHRRVDQVHTRVARLEVSDHRAQAVLLPRPCPPRVDLHLVGPGTAASARVQRYRDDSGNQYQYENPDATAPHDALPQDRCCRRQRRRARSAGQVPKSRLVGVAIFVVTRSFVDGSPERRSTMSVR